MNLVIQGKGIIQRFHKIKIKNKKLEEYGFKIGTDFKVIYTKNKILSKLSIHKNKEKLIMSDDKKAKIRNIIKQLTIFPPKGGRSSQLNWE